MKSTSLALSVLLTTILGLGLATTANADVGDRQNMSVTSDPKGDVKFPTDVVEVTAISMADTGYFAAASVIVEYATAEGADKSETTVYLNTDSDDKPEYSFVSTFYGWDFVTMKNWKTAASVQSRAVEQNVYDIGESGKSFDFNVRELGLGSTQKWSYSVTSRAPGENKVDWAPNTPRTWSRPIVAGTDR